MDFSEGKLLQGPPSSRDLLCYFHKLKEVSERQFKNILKVGIFFDENQKYRSAYECTIETRKL